MIFKCSIHFMHFRDIFFHQKTYLFSYVIKSDNKGTAPKTCLLTQFIRAWKSTSQEQKLNENEKKKI